MKKRFMAGIMTVAMVAGCLSGGVAVHADSDDGFTIGMRFPVTLDQMQNQTMANVEELIQTAGGRASGRKRSTDSQREIYRLTSV